MFERLDGRNGRLAEVSATVEHVRDRAVDASDQLTAIVTRMRDLDEHVAGFETLKAQIAEMTDVVRLAKEAAALMSDSGGQLQKHREAMEQLEDEYREARAAIEALAAQRQLVTDAHVELQRSHADMRSAIDEVSSIKRELGQLRSQVSAVANDQAAISKTAEHTLDSTAAATRTVKLWRPLAVWNAKTPDSASSE